MTDFAELFQKRPDSADGAIKPGLSRIRRAYDFLDRPGHGLPTVLVGGTNGKGSTAGQLWRMLALAGEKPALFTSPHLVHFSERFQIANEEIDDLRIATEWQHLRERLPSEMYEELSFFEVATLIALSLFAEERVSHLILEVGLGGRWDATNVVDPDLSVITSIGRDHEQFLGHELDGIAREKAGIMRPGKPILWGGGSGELADQAIRAAAATIGATLQVYPQDIVDPDLPVPSVTYQRSNLALAAAAARYFIADWTVVKERWSESVYRPNCMRARFEHWLGAYQGRNVLVDACHNPAGAQAFAQACDGVASDTVFVTTSQDKDRSGMAAALQRQFSRVVFFGTNADRAWRPNGDLPVGTQWYEDFETAVTAVADAVDDPSRPLVICGSILGIGALIQSGILRAPQPG